MILVILVGQIFQDRESLPEFQSAVCRGDERSEHLPNDEVVVVVVNDGGDATVGVDLQVVWTLLLFLAEVKVHRLVCQPEFFKNDGCFPKIGLVFSLL